MIIKVLDRLKWLLMFGLPKKKSNIFEVRQSDFKDVKEPVFMLSTGRSGTKWFSELLSLDKSTCVLHDPTPNLAFQNTLAYEYLNKSNGSCEVEVRELLKEMYLAAREPYINYSVKTDKRLIETNNSITFFAPILLELFPNAKFIHVIRPPVKFIISGLRRDYYTDSPSDLRRINITDDSYSQVHKIAKLWETTNQFVEKLKENPIYKDRFHTFIFDDLDTKSIKSLLDFINVDVSETNIKKRIPRPSNIQSKGKISSFDNWPIEQKKAIKNICGELASKYGIQ